MKKITKITILLVAAVAILINGCKKGGSDQEPEVKGLAKTPDAVVVNNTSSKGIYKGVFIGSTGTIKFDIANNGSAITATMVVDGVTGTLTSTTPVVAGSKFSGKFTGTVGSAAVELVFSVDADGGNPAISSIVYPGHPTAQIIVNKETSTSLIEGYTGTYSSNRPESGTFNMIINRTDAVWSVIAREDGATTFHVESGKIVNSKLLDSQGKALATLGTDTIDGSFTGGKNNTEITTIKGKRSL